MELVVVQFKLFYWHVKVPFFFPYLLLRAALKNLWDLNLLAYPCFLIDVKNWSKSFTPPLLLTCCREQCLEARRVWRGYVACRCLRTLQGPMIIGNLPSAEEGERDREGGGSLSPTLIKVAQKQNNSNYMLHYRQNVLHPQLRRLFILHWGE